MNDLQVSILERLRAENESLPMEERKPDSDLIALTLKVTGTTNNSGVFEKAKKATPIQMPKEIKDAIKNRLKAQEY